MGSWKSESRFAPDVWTEDGAMAAISLEVELQQGEEIPQAEWVKQLTERW